MSDTAHFVHNPQGFYSMRSEYVETMTRHMAGRTASGYGLEDIKIHRTIIDRDPKSLAQSGREHLYSYTLSVNNGVDALVIKPGYKKNDSGDMECLGAVVIKGTHQIARMEFEAFYTANGEKDIERVEKVFGAALDRLTAAELQKSGRSRGGENSLQRPVLAGATD